MVTTRTSGAWERSAWVAGLVFVVALVAESIVSVGVEVNQDDSAAKIAAYGIAAIHARPGALFA